VRELRIGQFVADPPADGDGVYETAAAQTSAVAEVLAVPHLDEDVLDTGTGESPPRLTCASASRR
jgi:hypothetical protein